MFSGILCQLPVLQLQDSNIHCRVV